MENAEKLPKFMLLHFGRTRLIWDWLMLVIVAYIAIAVPFNTSFKPSYTFTFLYFIDMLFEIFFVCDMIINFRTTFVDPKSGKLVTRPIAIAKNYLKSWFFIDFLAALPFELLYFADRSWVIVLLLFKFQRIFDCIVE